MNTVAREAFARRDLYAAEAMADLPSLLQLLDRNPLSRTFGCFDRSYWHFRTMDFPSGMSQECTLPLALVWRHPFPDNPFHGKERVREWVLGALDFARRSAHRDGSSDDYYPFERALGATVYALYALAEAYRIVEADVPALRDFLVHRARWVASHGETGVLTNHHAIAAAALQAVAALTGDATFANAAARKAAEVAEHQHAEGWFREYEGFDPGYQTVTVDFLARYWKASGDATVLPVLERAVTLLERVQHPDGSFGGEYASRNTYHAQPHGFELLAPKVPAAFRVADRFLDALAARKRARNDDDRLLAHHVYPLLLAWLDYAPRTSGEATRVPPKPERIVLEGCGFLVDRGPTSFLIAGLRKGAPFRAYFHEELVGNDSGIALRLDDGRLLVSHLAHDATVEDQDGVAVSRGSFHPARGELMTPAKAVILRLIMLTIGRFSRNLVRRLLQKRLILGRAASPFRFERRIERVGDGFRVTDTIRRDPGAPRVASLRLGVGQTSIYIAVSNPWEAGWLLPWTSLDAQVPELNAGGEVTHVRLIGPVPPGTG